MVVQKLDRIHAVCGVLNVADAAVADTLIQIRSGDGLAANRQARAIIGIKANGAAQADALRWIDVDVAANAHRKVAVVALRHGTRIVAKREQVSASKVANRDRIVVAKVD